jgi:hypothetical protein
MVIHPEFELGEVVYLRVGEEDRRGMVTCYRVTADGGMVYGISWGDRQDREHYAVELSRVPTYAGVPNET